MRKLAVAVALASTAMAAPALARDGSWYIGLEGGPMIVEDLKLDIGGLNDAGSVDTKTGYDFDGIIGYDFGGFRAEAEVGYREANVDSFTSQTTTFRGGTFPSAAAGTFSGAAGQASALSFMINGMLDFGDDDGLNGFVGGGAGVARVKFNNFSINPAGNFLDDSDTGFAWQAIAGVRAPLTENVDVGLKYRFFNADNLDMVGGDGRAVSTRFRSHSLLGSFIFNFGAPEVVPVAAPAPAPEPLPAPAPEPVPVARVCQPGPYIVFFEWDRSDITPEAAGILDNAVTSYADCANTQVVIAGHTDTSGTPRYNLGLSQRRADAVRAYMTGRGIADGSITTQALGESNLRVQTADGVRELQNRRVEITYGAGAGQ